MSDDEFDAIPDEFEGLQVDWDAIPGLGPAPVPPGSPDARSSQYSFDDELDDEFLAAVNELERRAVAEGPSTSAVAASSTAQSSSTTNQRPSRYFNRPQPVQAEPIPSTRSKEKWPPTRSSAKRAEASSSRTESARESRSLRKRSPPSSPVQVSSTKKGRVIADVLDGVREVLAAFEDEMTCPICYDIFAAAHLHNPCGHTVCGECGQSWMSKNKTSPRCACCRALLNVSAPMIPNFAVDNTVEKHVRALGASGDAEWQKDGQKLKDWQSRKQKWKDLAAKQNAQRPARGSRNPTRGATFYEVYYDALFRDDDEGDADEGEVELGSRPLFRPNR